MDIEAETRHNQSLDATQRRHFERLAGEWWNMSGKFRALHAFNPARLQFITSEIKGRRSSPEADFRPLAGLAVLDIGCGGGVLSEPLARLGGEVTGIDPVAASIASATAHASHRNLSVTYRVNTAEELALENAAFDVVVASEVIEHTADMSAFLEACRALCKPRGLLFVSTLNRTLKSYALAIIAAEHILGLIPRGTHEWRKFIKPAEIETALAAAGFKKRRINGIVFDPLRGHWMLSPSDFSVNYILSAEAA